MNKHSKQDPLVTVVTSVFNGGKTLEETINSVIRQTYKNIEYIIIDGGSVDNSIEVIKKYSKKITLWKSEPDNGIYDAWNKAISFSKGEWISFLGSDDILKDTAIEEMIEVVKNSEFEFDYISGLTEIEKNGKIIRISGEPWSWKKFKKYVCTGHNAALHNKRIFEKYGLYDINYKSSGDYEMLLRVGNNLRAGYVHKVTSKMRMGGISNSSNIAIRETYRAILANGHTTKIVAYIIFTKNLFVCKVKNILRLQ